MVQGDILRKEPKKEEKLFDIFLNEKFPNIKRLELYKGYRTPIKFIDENNSIVRSKASRFFKEREFSGDFSRLPSYSLEQTRSRNDYCFANYIFLRPEKGKHIKNIEAIPDFVDTKEKITVICPNCHHERRLSITTFINCKLEKLESCPFCNDGISFPNKILSYILYYFSPETADTEYSSRWTKKRRYDGFFKMGEQEYVAEMDGKQHYKDGYFCFKGEKIRYQPKNQKKIDKEKDELAQKQRVILIRIDCSKIYNNVLINNIQNSELGKLVDFSNFDWKECIKECFISKMRQVWNMYNQDQNISYHIIAEKVHITIGTVHRYLVLGNEMGACSYSGKEKPLKNLKKASESNRKKIKVIENGINQEFASIQKAAEFLSNLFNLKINSTRDYISKRLDTECNYERYRFETVIEKESDILNGDKSIKGQV